MRPKSIVNFERVVLLNILIGIVNLWLSWDKMLAAQQAKLLAQGQERMIGMLPNLFIGGEVVFVAIWLLLVWLISRKASPVAKWIYVVLAVIILIFAVLGLGKAAALGTVPMVLGIAAHLLTLASLWFLFQPDAKAWFSEGRVADPNDLR
jgi:asparagine N-glycosylation enzyme membrane subunit Stt3